MPEMLPEDVQTFLGKIKVNGSISRQSSTFPEIFIFQWNLPFAFKHFINLRTLFSWACHILQHFIDIILLFSIESEDELRNIRNKIAEYGIKDFNKF